MTRKKVKKESGRQCERVEWNKREVSRLAIFTYNSFNVEGVLTASASVESSESMKLI